jgi:hypothetical protein
MTERYNKLGTFPETISSPDWVPVAGFNYQWKLFLFNPSLRIGGIKQ